MLSGCVFIAIVL